MKFNWKFMGLGFLLYLLLCLLVQFPLRLLLQEWLVQSGRVLEEDIIYSLRVILLGLVYIVLFFVLMIVRENRKEWVISAALATTVSIGVNLVGTLVLGALTLALATTIKWFFDLLRAYYFRPDAGGAENT